jgi:hypothetical protein
MEAANGFVLLALVAFVAGVAICFATLPPRRAALFALFGGWLFLPVFEIAFSVPLLHEKIFFLSAVVLAASAVFHGDRWRRLRPGAIDLPILVLCVSPLATSVANGLGAYDGLQAAFQLSLAWGGPYLLGRIYLGEPGGIRDLAAVHVGSALLYVPLCLWEIRMSPQLHRTLYGFHQHAFIQSVRYGGYRPVVFLEHGLAVGMFMSSATLLAVWLLRTGARRALAGIPMGWIAAGLAVTTILCKSAGAILLLAVGLAVLEGVRRARRAALVFVLAALPIGYCAARLSGWSAGDLVDVAGRYIDLDRAQSLEYRLRMENLLIARALERPALGWGRWGRSRVYDESGEDITVTDGMWVIELGTGGFLKLAANLLVLLIPPVVLAWRLRPGELADPRVAAALALAVALLLSSIDDLFNAMASPFFPAIAGALCGLVRLPWRTAPRARPVPAPALLGEAAGAHVP